MFIHFREMIFNANFVLMFKKELTRIQKFSSLTNDCLDCISKRCELSYQLNGALLW